MNNFFPLGILSIVLLLSGCKDRKENFDPGFGYYPVEVGDYKIYQVHKVNYQPNDTTVENFQIKELVAERFIINGEQRFRLERYKRNDDNFQWPPFPDSVWSVSVTSSKVIRIENNTRFVKLVFPVETGKSWNGNIENAGGEDLYFLRNVDKPYTLLSHSYPQTVTVEQSPNDSSTFLYKDYREEVFAKDIGMVARIKEMYEYKLKDNMTIDPACRIDVGLKYHEKLISYGRQ